jgi:hypothetical protein
MAIHVRVEKVISLLLFMLGIMGSTLDIFFLSGWMCSLSRGAIRDASVYNDGAIMLL